MVKISSLLILLVLILTLYSHGQTFDKGDALGLYPDLVVGDDVLVASLKIEPTGTQHLRSISAIVKKDGRCAIPLTYEIINKSAIDVKQRFYSTIFANSEINSTRLINGIDAGETKEIKTVVWLEAGKDTETQIVLDSYHNVSESVENKNIKEFTLLLSGSCESDSEEPLAEEGEPKGLFDRFEYRIQDHKLYK